MKLHLLEGLIDSFLKSQLHKEDPSWVYSHDLVNHFNQSWSEFKDLSLKERLDLSMRSEISQRWWKRENYRPKELMLKLIDVDEELAGIAFKDLANDSATLDGRLSRFNFYAEELIQMYRRNHKRDIETNHQQDAGIISLYLAGWFPEKYSLYPGLDLFANFCRIIGSPDIPVVDDLVRYEKVAAIIYKFLQKNPLFQKLSEERVLRYPKNKFLPFQTTYEIVSANGL